MHPPPNNTSSHVVGIPKSSTQHAFPNPIAKKHQRSSDNFSVISQRAGLVELIVDRGKQASELKSVVCVCVSYTPHLR
jgi:hypothetical protein